MADFRRGEFIGLEVEVLGSTCEGLVGTRGRVVDESRNMLVIEVGGTEKKVPKDVCEFRFFDGGREFVVSGKDIKFRPEDRVKKVR